MRFYKTEISGPFVPDVAHTRSVGSAALPFLTAYADTFYGAFSGNLTGNVTGNVAGNLTGDVYNSASEKILENGTDYTLNDGWLIGVKIRSTNASPCLDPSNTPANATFTGTATKAKYA